MFLLNNRCERDGKPEFKNKRYLSTADVIRVLTDDLLKSFTEY
jgi:hypothetical protein